MPTTYAHPIYDPGPAVPAKANGANVIGGRFVKIVAAKLDGGNVLVQHAGAGDEPIGIAAHDAIDFVANPRTAKPTSVYGSGFWLLATASAAIAAGAAVQLAADGKVAPYSNGRKVGVAAAPALAANDRVLIKVQL
jgi:hypothetical protein